MSADNIQPLLELTRIIQIHKIILMIVVFILLVGVVKFIQMLGARLQQRFHGKRLLILQIVTIISFFLYIVGGGSLFYIIFKPKKELLLAIGASAAVAIGFALKDLVGSIVAGIVLLFDRPFQVGDRVRFNDVYGEIVTIGLRTVRLKTLTDDMVTIPNSKFFTDVVSSGNSGALDMMITVDFYISLDADILKAKELLYEIVVTSKYVFLKKPVKIVADEVAIAERLAIKLTVKAYVLDVQFEKDFQTDIVTRTAIIFTKNSISRPARL